MGQIAAFLTRYVRHVKEGSTMPYNSESLSKNVRRNVAWNSSHLLRSQSQKFVQLGPPRRRSINFTLEDETLTVLASLRLYYQEYKCQGIGV
jgi:hypothetical protein